MTPFGPSPHVVDRPQITGSGPDPHPPTDPLCCYLAPPTHHQDKNLNFKFILLFLSKYAVMVCEAEVQSSHDDVEAVDNKSTSMRTHLSLLSALMSLVASSEPAEAMNFKKASEIMQVKKLSEFAVIPTRGSQYAAGKGLDTMKLNTKKMPTF